MIISHKYKFIFIKTRKTAGTSIEVFLSQCCGDEDVVTPIKPHVEPHRARNYRSARNPIPELLETRGSDVLGTLRRSLLQDRVRYFHHMPATLVRRRTARTVWDSYFKFCVERNPWDRFLSQYHMANASMRGALTLDEYISKGEFWLNFPLYTDTGGNKLVDRVLKYETLMEELGEVFRQLNIPFDGTLGVNAKSDLRKDRRPYQDVFTAAQREVVDKEFAKEIEMHGYTF